MRLNPFRLAALTGVAVLIGLVLPQSATACATKCGFDKLGNPSCVYSLVRQECYFDLDGVDCSVQPCVGIVAAPGDPVLQGSAAPTFCSGSLDSPALAPVKSTEKTAVLILKARS